MGPVVVVLTYLWVITTLRWHKITTSNPTIIFLGLNVGGTWNHNTFALNSSNTKWITKISINWIIPTQRWYHMGFYAMTLRWPNHPIISVYAQTNFLGGEVSGTMINTTSNITIITILILMTPILWRMWPGFFRMDHWQWISQYW